MEEKMKRLICLEEQIIAAEMMWKYLDKRLKVEKDENKKFRLQLEKKIQLHLMYQYSAESMLLRYCEK